LTCFLNSKFLNIIELFIQKIVKALKIWGWDPEKLIPDQGFNKAPDPQHWLQFRVFRYDHYVFILAWLEVTYYFSEWTVHSLIGSGFNRVSGSVSGSRRAKMTH
jgi:hypothetical protein